MSSNVLLPLTCWVYRPTRRARRGRLETDGQAIVSSTRRRTDRFLGEIANRRHVQRADMHDDPVPAVPPTGVLRGAGGCTGRRRPNVFLRKDGEGSSYYFAKIHDERRLTGPSAGYDAIIFFRTFYGRHKICSVSVSTAHFIIVSAAEEITNLQ